MLLNFDTVSDTHVTRDFVAPLFPQASPKPAPPQSSELEIMLELNVERSRNDFEHRLEVQLYLLSTSEYS